VLYKGSAQSTFAKSSCAICIPIITAAIPMPPCVGIGAAGGIGPAQAPSRIIIIKYNIFISLPPRRGEHMQHQPRQVAIWGI